MGDVELVLSKAQVKATAAALHAHLEYGERDEFNEGRDAKEGGGGADGEGNEEEEEALVPAAKRT